MTKTKKEKSKPKTSTKKKTKAPAKKAEKNGISGWFIVLGTLLILGGIFALLAPVTMTVLTQLIMAWSLIFAGTIQFVGAIIERQTNNVWLGMAMALISLLFGVLLLTNIVAGLAAVTIMMGILFMFEGTAKAIVSVTVRPDHWGWLLTSGLISIVLSVIILTNLVTASLVLLGMLVGIYMILGGIEMITLYYTTNR